MTEGAPAVGPADPTDHEDRFRRESALHHWLVSGALVLVVGPALVVAGIVIVVADDASDGLRLLGGLLILVGVCTPLSMWLGWRALRPRPLDDVDLVVGGRRHRPGDEIAVRYRGEQPATVHLVAEGWKWHRVYTSTPARADYQRRRVLHDESVEVPTEWEGAFELPVDAEASVDGIPGVRWLVEARRSPRPFARRTVVPIIVESPGTDR